MEENQTEQNVSSPELAEIKSPSQSTTTQSLSSQSSGTIPKVATKTKPGGVKLGSFRIGGRKKITEGDSNIEKTETKKSKKCKKEKIDGTNKSESEDSAASTPSPGTKHSIPSRASSFVRRLSIGKYRSPGPGKSVKSPDTPSSQEYHSASTEEESFSTASATSATETRSNPEAVVGSSMPTEDVASTIDQWAADSKAVKSNSNSNDSVCNNDESLTLTMSGTKDTSPLLTSQNEIAEAVKDENESTIEKEVSVPELAARCDVNMTETRKMSFEGEEAEDASAYSNGDVILPTHFCKPLDVSPPCTLPPTEEEKVSKHERWFRQEYDKETGLPIEDPDEKRQRAKNKILLATTPMVEKYRHEMEEYMNSLGTAEPHLKPHIPEMPKLVVPKMEPSQEPEPTLKRRKRTMDMPATSDGSLYQKFRVPQQNAEKREHLYKILVIGELGTGKTSIIKRYVHQFFSQHYRATIGVDFALKVLSWDQDTVIRLQLWDIAGQERFGNMTRVYYKEAVGAFIVFDVTRAATFDAVVKWKQDLDTKVQLPDGSPIPCVLLANKCDQQKEGLVNNAAKMDEYCKERGFTAWFETSAKENINIEDAARCLVTKILQNDKMIHNNESPKDLERFTLDGRNQRQQKSKTCAC